MSDIADFLRARYRDELDRQGRIYRDIYEPRAACPICGKPTEEMWRIGGDPSALARFEPCGHETNDPADLESFQEPAPDPDVIADLEAKLRILDEVVPEIDAMEARIDGEWGVGDPAERESAILLRILAQPFSGHPGHKGEEWAA